MKGWEREEGGKGKDRDRKREEKRGREEWQRKIEKEW